MENCQQMMDEDGVVWAHTHATAGARCHLLVLPALVSALPVFAGVIASAINIRWCHQSPLVSLVSAGAIS